MANDINLGLGPIDNIMLGGDQVDKVMLGDVEVWSHVVVPADFYAEFTMEDTTKLFKIDVSGTKGIWQYSNDNINWIDRPTTSDLTKSGSLKWYVRQKPGGQLVTRFCFLSSEFKTCDSLEIGQFNSATDLFRSCTNLISLPKLDTSNVTRFSSTFANCNSLMYLPYINTSKGVKFDNTFNGCAALQCMVNIDTTSSIDKFNMFNGCTSLIAPNAAERGQIAHVPGISWTNPNPCP